MGNQAGGVQFAGGNEAQYFLTVAAVHAAGFKGQVFTLHLGQGQGLGPVI